MYKVLIVEDDMVIARTMYRHLQSWGYQVSCVTDFQNVMQQFVALDPIWYFWICPCLFITGFIGVTKFERIPRFRWSSSPQLLII